MRGFLVRGMSNLVLLRAKDTPFYEEHNSMAMIRNSSMSSVVSMYTAGLNRIQKMIEESNAAAQQASSGNHVGVDQ
jgi:hypothetical protein